MAGPSYSYLRQLNVKSCVYVCTLARVVVVEALLLVEVVCVCVRACACMCVRVCVC